MMLSTSRPLVEVCRAAVAGEVGRVAFAAVSLKPVCSPDPADEVAVDEAIAAGEAENKLSEVTP